MMFIKTFYFYNEYRNKPESFIVLIIIKQFTVFYVNLFSVIITNSWIYVHQYNILIMFCNLLSTFILTSINKLSTLNLYLHIIKVVTLQPYRCPLIPIILISQQKDIQSVFTCSNTKYSVHCIYITLYNFYTLLFRFRCVKNSQFFLLLNRITMFNNVT